MQKISNSVLLELGSKSFSSSLFGFYPSDSIRRARLLISTASYSWSLLLTRMKWLL